MNGGTLEIISKAVTSYNQILHYVHYCGMTLQSYNQVDEPGQRCPLRRVHRSIGTSVSIEKCIESHVPWEQEARPGGYKNPLICGSWPRNRVGA